MPRLIVTLVLEVVIVSQTTVFPALLQESCCKSRSLICTSFWHSLRISHCVLVFGAAGELKLTSLHPAECLSWPCINITMALTELLPR